jgi:hypothetical protein
LKFIISLLGLLSICFAQSNILLSDIQNQYLEYASLKSVDISNSLYQPFSDRKISEILISDTTNWGKSITRILRHTPKTVVIGSNSDGLYGNYENSSLARIGVTAFGIFRTKHIAAIYQYRADTDYQEDEYFGSYGKFGTKVIGRTTDSYIQYQRDSFTLFMGRKALNFALINNYSLILSDNAHSFDHLSFEFNPKFFRYYFITTRLEDKLGYDVRDIVLQESWHKRYLSFHYLEIVLRHNLEIGLSESILYGGNNQAFLPMYMNPVNVWFISKMVERKGVEEPNANAMMGLDILYRPIDHIVVYSQFLIDDMDFTKATRERYPDRIGYAGKIVWLDPLPESMVSLEYAYISNWTYNSYYTYGNYTYYGQSLGYPENGITKYEITFDSFNYARLHISASLFLQKKRAQDMETHFVDIKTVFPIGTVETSSGAIFELNYISEFNSTFGLKMKYSNYLSYQNINNLNESFFDISLSYDYSLYYPH